MLKDPFTSVVCFIWHKMIHCSVFQLFWFLFTPLCLLCVALKMQQHESSENIHITRWPDVSWNVFKLLFNESKLACVKISIKPPGVNKERREKSQQTTRQLDYSSWFSPKMLSSSSSWVWLGLDHVLTTNEPVFLKVYRDHLFKEVLVHLFAWCLCPQTAFATFYLHKTTTPRGTMNSGAIQPN